MSSAYETIPDVESGAGRPKLTRKESSRDGKTQHATFGHTSHFWLDPSEHYSGDHSHELRAGFIRKVYGILSAQLLLTCAVAAFMMSSKSVSAFVLKNTSWIQWVVIVPMFLVLFKLMSAKDEYPLNMQLLFGFTGIMSFNIGTVCVIYQEAGLGSLILEAALTTAITFLALIAFACQSRYDYTVFNGMLLTVLSSMIVYSFFCMIFGFSPGILYSWLGCLVFCAFVVVDTQKIMTKFGYDDYIIAAIELYLDILNLFLFILQILASGSRD